LNLLVTCHTSGRRL